MNSQQFVLFQCIADRREYWPHTYACFYLSLLGGNSSFMIWIPQTCMSSKCECPPNVHTIIGVCVYKLLAGLMKYSWRHGGIGCRAWSRANGVEQSTALCVLKQLVFPLYKEMSRGRENRGVWHCRCSCSAHRRPPYCTHNRHREGTGLHLSCFRFADVLV